MRREKHIPYFELVDTFKAPECPVCFLVKDRRDKYFNTLVYEHLTDKFFRVAFNKASGFCNEHSHKFLDYSAGAGISIVHESLLDIVIGYIEKGTLGKMKYTGPCKVCEIEQSFERQYLETILAYIDDAAFKNDFLQSHGLCVPHCRDFMRDAWPLPKWFTEFHLEKYKNFRASMRRFIDSTDFVKKDTAAATEEDKTAWRKIIPLMAGYRGRKER
ncbi:MAG: hypothetical protein HZC28_18140 [Spirochaetes bacterium]|nr:hypothetical protein [Spirochaetota bacterium]